MKYPDIIWPWWVRVTHWMVAAGIISLWLMRYVWYETDEIHRLVGYIVFAVIIVRILLGFVSHSTAARFYLPGKKAISAHLIEVRSGKVSLHQRHNPLGQWAVYLIWLLIALLVVTGWLSRTDALWGEDWPLDLHAALSFCLLGLMCVHVLAVFLLSRLSQQNLLSQMIHGRPAPIKKKHSRFDLNIFD